MNTTRSETDDGGRPPTLDGLGDDNPWRTPATTTPGGLGFVRDRQRWVWHMLTHVLLVTYHAPADWGTLLHYANAAGKPRWRVLGSVTRGEADDAMRAAVRLHKAGQWDRWLADDNDAHLPPVILDALNLRDRPGGALYVETCARPPATLAERIPHNRRGNDDDTVVVSGLWCDLDVESGDAHKGGHPLPPDYAEAYNVATRVSLWADPWVLYSGHGLWLWQPLPGPLVVEPQTDGRVGATIRTGDTPDTAEAHAAAALLPWYAQRLVADEYNTRQWGLDATGDRARVMRLAGSVNHKAGGSLDAGWLTVGGYQPKRLGKPPADVVDTLVATLATLKPMVGDSTDEGVGTVAPAETTIRDGWPTPGQPDTDDTTRPRPSFTEATTDDDGWLDDAPVVTAEDVTATQTGLDALNAAVAAHPGASWDVLTHTVDVADWADILPEGWTEHTGRKQRTVDGRPVRLFRRPQGDNDHSMVCWETSDAGPGGARVWSSNVPGLRPGRYSRAHIAAWANGHPPTADGVVALARALARGDLRLNNQQWTPPQRNNAPAPVGLPTPAPAETRTDNNDDNASAADTPDDNAPPPSLVAVRDRYGLVPFSTIRVGQPVSWLVEGVLPASGLVVLYGKPGQGKTFVGLGIALDAARQGLPVVYSAAEGHGGLSTRVAGWAEAAPPGVDDATMDRHFHMPRQPLALGTAEAATWCEGVARDYRPGVFVVDTFAAHNNNADENDNAKADAALRPLRALAAADCCVVIVHHEGVEGGRPRGATALDGAVDTALHAKKHDTDDGRSHIELTVKKQRDAPSGLSVRWDCREVAGTLAAFPSLGSPTVAPVKGGRPRSVERLAADAACAAADTLDAARDALRAGVAGGLYDKRTARRALDAAVPLRGWDAPA